MAGHDISMSGTNLSMYNIAMATAQSVVAPTASMHASPEQSGSGSGQPIMNLATAPREDQTVVVAAATAPPITPFTHGVGCSPSDRLRAQITV